MRNVCFSCPFITAIISLRWVVEICSSSCMSVILTRSGGSYLNGPCTALLAEVLLPSKGTLRHQSPYSNLKHGNNSTYTICSYCGDLLHFIHMYGWLNVFCVDILKGQTSDRTGSYQSSTDDESCVPTYYDRLVRACVLLSTLVRYYYFWGNGWSMQARRWVSQVNVLKLGQVLTPLE